MLNDLATLVGRILLSAIFILSGYGKIAGLARLEGQIAAIGLPSAMAPLVIATELGCGILILIGLLTRPAAFLLAGYCVLTAVFFHYSPGDAGQMNNFMKNFAMCGGFLVLMMHGPGRLSLDHLIFRGRDGTSDPLRPRAAART